MNDNCAAILKQHEEKVKNWEVTKEKLSRQLKRKENKEE